MSLIEKDFDVQHSSTNFFDHVFGTAKHDLASTMAEMNRMRNQMYQLMPLDPLGDTLAPEMAPRVPVVEERGEAKLKLEFDVHKFTPEEVKVKILGDNMLQVHAQHEEKTAHGMKKSLYIRQYSLPKGIDAKNLKPTLTKDGVLTIEAPAHSLAPGERLIPIADGNPPAIVA